MKTYIVNGTKIEISQNSYKITSSTNTLKTLLEDNKVKDISYNSQDVFIRHIDLPTEIRVEEKENNIKYEFLKLIQQEKSTQPNLSNLSVFYNTKYNFRCVFTKKDSNLSFTIYKYDTNTETTPIESLKLSKQIKILSIIENNGIIIVLTDSKTNEIPILNRIVNMAPNHVVNTDNPLIKTQNRIKNPQVIEITKYSQDTEFKNDTPQVLYTHKASKPEIEQRFKNINVLYLIKTEEESKFLI